MTNESTPKGHDEFQSELIVGLVGAVGTEVRQVVEFLTERLELAGYKVELVKVSNDVIPLCGPISFDPENQYDRIDKMMDAGNDAREKAKDSGVLANGVAALIYQQRPKNGNGESAPNFRRVYIVDSLKTPKEVDQLRKIYPGGFVLVGIHSEKSRRLKNLVENRGITNEDAERLIERDGEEKLRPYGQRLNKTFHLADFFVRITENRERLRSDIRRMVEIWFGNPHLTPTFDEFAMFMAFSSALRSADLSRQVGAVIARDNTILATGANDCPKFGGGLYWPERDKRGVICDIENSRDYMRDGDQNRIEQLGIIDEIVKSCNTTPIDADELRGALEKSRLSDLTEFGRVVHAEMEALLACGRTGTPTMGGTLYSTTFPCHNCAKHIVAAGIRRVVYIEPYPKSRAIDFHNDSITTTPGPEKTKVQFVPFVGIGPRRYFELFSMSGFNTYPLIRKNSETGVPVNWAIEKAKLRVKMLPDSYLGFELEASNKFENVIQEGTDI